MKISTISEDRNAALKEAISRARPDGYFYHVTPEYNVESILKDGLVPKSSSERTKKMPDDRYEPTIFLALTRLDADVIANLFYEFSGIPPTTKFSLLRIPRDSVTNVKKDPYFPGGVTTTSPIPREAIQLVPHEWFNFWYGDDNPFLNGTWRE